MRQLSTPKTPFRAIFVTIGLIALSGCAEIGSAGKFAWNQTETAADFLYSPVAALLRDTPKQTETFSLAQAPLSDAPLSEKASDVPDTETMPRISMLPAGDPFSEKNYDDIQQANLDAQASLRGLHTNQDVEFEVYETQTVFAASAQMKPGILSSTLIYGNTGDPIGNETEVPNIQFSKTDGPSDLEDWFDCEAEAEGYVKITQTGYHIEPQFDSCMRQRGYTAENKKASPKTDLL